MHCSQRHRDYEYKISSTYAPWFVVKWLAIVTIATIINGGERGMEHCPIMARNKQLLKPSLVRQISSSIWMRHASWEHW